MQQACHPPGCYPGTRCVHSFQLIDVYSSLHGTKLSPPWIEKLPLRKPRPSTTDQLTHSNPWPMIARSWCRILAPRSGTRSAQPSILAVPAVTMSAFQAAAFSGATSGTSAWCHRRQPPVSVSLQAQTTFRHPSRLQSRYPAPLRIPRVPSGRIAPAAESNQSI